MSEIPNNNPRLSDMSTLKAYFKNSKKKNHPSNQRQCHDEP